MDPCIRIDISNNKDIINFFIYFVPLIPGWILDGNVNFGNYYWNKCINNTPRFFAFNLIEKRFSWECGDSSVLEDRTISDYQSINTIEAAEELCDWIFSNNNLFSSSESTNVIIKQPNMSVFTDKLKEKVKQLSDQIKDSTDSFISNSGVDGLCNNNKEIYCCDSYSSGKNKELNPPTNFSLTKRMIDYYTKKYGNIFHQINEKDNVIVKQPNMSVLLENIVKKDLTKEVKAYMDINDNLKFLNESMIGMNYFYGKNV